MLVTGKTRLSLRIQNALFVVLALALAGLLAWLSTRYVIKADWTAGNRNSLSEPSVKLLASLDQPIRITAFASEREGLRESIESLVERYRAVKADITLEFVNPELEPQRVRELGITTDGELVIEYGGRSEHLTGFGESQLTNLLQRLARSTERWLAFVEGHGERDPQGQANFDLGAFGRELERKGFKIHRLNLTETPAIPDNTAVLVIAGPQTDFLPGEVKLLRDYVARGGNLLWLAEPGGTHGLDALAADLGVSFLRGMLVDPNTRMLGLDDPALVLVPEYPYHPITQNFRYLTLFPYATALEVKTPEGWQAQALLETLPRTWQETGKLEGAVSYDAKQGDREGPLALGYALTRAVKPPAPEPAGNDEKKKGGQDAAAEDEARAREQRVVVIGDGDFLANTYLGNSGNLDLGLNIINWLSHDDAFIAVHAKSAPDVTLALSPSATLLISTTFLLVLPALLLGSGFAIWWRRRRM
ncbi:MAG TPA: GldG family protein [Gammaproteobacteria bacterium]|nr:GldG family protein [Gammaproteobacteria bacterium]